MRKKIIGIMASTKEGVIGLKNDLPWNYPEELGFFYEQTQDQIMIMGRKTYDENSPLNHAAERIILSKQENFIKPKNNTKAFINLENLLEYIENYKTNKKIFMIGGGEIANLFLEKNLISEFFLTEIHKNYEGDAYLDLNHFKKWTKQEIKKTENYTINFLTNPNYES